VTDQCHARLLRFGGDALETSYSLARKRADLLGDVLRHCCDGVILLNIDTHHARRFDGAISPRKRRAKGKRHLTKDRARDSPAEPTFDPVERLDDLDLACEHDKERALSAFVDSEFSRTKVEVGGCPGEALQIDRRKSRKQRDRHNVVDRQHSFPPFAFTQAMIGTSDDTDRAERLSLHRKMAPAHR
jgi:hypothetical protein